MRNGSHHYKLIGLLSIVLFVAGAASKAFGQATAFTYQGRLQDAGTNANGNYDFQFTLWDAANGGTQQPQPSPLTVSKNNVGVANGVFTVQLDFGASAFPGADRFLEIGVRPTGGSAFTVLSPRQSISSTPYAIRAVGTTAADSLSNACNSCVQSTQINSVAGAKVVGIVASATDATNAFQLGGVPANNYVLTSDFRLTDSRPPSPGSPNYIQNTSVAQSSSSFNVSGTGNVGGTLVTGTQGIPVVFNGPPNLKLIVTGDSALIGHAFFSTSGTNGVRITPANDGDIGVLNVTNAANTINWLTVGNNGQVIMNGSGSVGIGTANPIAKLHVQGETRLASSVYVGFLMSGGNTSLCWGPGYLSTCGSSLRYKTNVDDFAAGLTLIRKLHPITFDWKSDSTHDVGLIAEDVEKVTPLLVTHNKDGQVEGVKYDKLTVVLINAVKEQQAQIDKQQKQIDALKILACRSHRHANLCR